MKLSYAKAAAVLSAPDQYSRAIVAKARALIRDSERNAKRQSRTLPDD